MATVRAVGRHGADSLATTLWPAQALVVGEIDEIVPAEGEDPFEAAGQEARELVFDGPANLERERAIVGRLSVPTRSGKRLSTHGRLPTDG